MRRRRRRRRSSGGNTRAHGCTHTGHTHAGQTHVNAQIHTEWRRGRERGTAEDAYDEKK